MLRILLTLVCLSIFKHYIANEWHFLVFNGHVSKNHHHLGRDFALRNDIFSSLAEIWNQNAAAMSVCVSVLCEIFLIRVKYPSKIMFHLFQYDLRPLLPPNNPWVTSSLTGLQDNFISSFVSQFFKAVIGETTRMCQFMDWVGFFPVCLLIWHRFLRWEATEVSLATSAPSPPHNSFQFAAHCTISSNSLTNLQISSAPDSNNDFSCCCDLIQCSLHYSLILKVI